LLGDASQNTGAKPHQEKFPESLIFTPVFNYEKRIYPDPGFTPGFGPGTESTSIPFNHTKKK